MSKKLRISVNLDDNDLINVIKTHVKNPHVAKLMYDVFSKETQASEWLFKMQLGAQYPDVPKTGALGYLRIDGHTSWGGDWDKYRHSHFNQQGFIPVIVEEFTGLNNYYPLKVTAPLHTGEDGVIWNNVFNIQIDWFVPEEGFDPYS